MEKFNVMRINLGNLDKTNYLGKNFSLGGVLTDLNIVDATPKSLRYVQMKGVIVNVKMVLLPSDTGINTLSKK